MSLDVSGQGVLEWLAVQDALFHIFSAMFVKTYGRSALCRRISMRCQTGTENLSQAWPQERVACPWQRLVTCVCCDLCFNAHFEACRRFCFHFPFAGQSGCAGKPRTQTISYNFAFIDYLLVLRSVLNCQQEPANPI